jgi:NhaP-type Na+/H+ or K+/H+ antiporter
MLNDVIGYTSYESFLDIHLLTDSTHKMTKTLGVILWIGIAIAMGYGIGLLTALLCKYTGANHQDNRAELNDSIRDIDNTLYSTDFAVMFLAPWIAYLLAETLDISAILTIFFCGLSLGQYAIYNLSPGCRHVRVFD